MNDKLKPVECDPAAWNKTIRDSVDSLLAQAGYSEDSSVRHQLACMNFTNPRPAECEPFGYWFERECRFANCYEAERYFDESDRLELLVALYTTPQPCPDCLKWATDMSQVTKTLRYIIGIAERGTATTLPDVVTVESFVLDYVKGLEAKVAELTQDLQTTSDALGHADSNDRELIEEQLGTIKALNIALGGEDSTSTENLIDAYEVDYNEEGLISLCRKMVAENVRLGDTVEFQKAGWASDYEQLTRAEAVIEKVSNCTWLPISALKILGEYREGK